MNNLWKILLGSVAVLAVILVGCQQGSGPAEPASQENPAQLNRLFVPDGAVITNATLYVYVTSTFNTQGIDVHRVTSPWVEGLVTWNNFGGAYNPTIVTTFPANALGWAQADITPLVQSWVAGTDSNYGLLIKQSLDTPEREAIYHSSEYVADSTLRPKLVITYVLGGNNGSVTIQRGLLGEVADAYIHSLAPDTRFGDSDVLYTRVLSENSTKYSLLRFYLDVPSQGCTRTPGYWMTHSLHGPASYDDTWALILPSGENSPFFFSGQTYYGVISFPNSGGNAYYILGQAYIAAKLNFLAGASIPPAVQTAFDNATALFNNPTNTPSYIGSLKGGNALRLAFLTAATTLDDYNNGLIGPGHCE